MRHTAVLLNLLWVSGVYGSSDQPAVEKLNCIEGQTISFSAAVKITGFLRKGKDDIAKVISAAFSILPSRYNTYNNRLQWNSSTGFFSISGLKEEDSGEYTVRNQVGTKITSSVFQLAVYNPVSTPQVSNRNKMEPTCSVLCSVENGREVTLSWQREGETLSHTSSPDLNTPLSLPLEIEENSAPYSCVASNPVGARTVVVIPEKYCFDSVSKPRITSTAAEGYQGRYCSLLCSVENGREVTLSWQREGETLSHTSNPDLSSLTLLLEIKESNITYSCVAKNPISEERTAFYPSQHCREKDSEWRWVILGVGFIIVYPTIIIYHCFAKGNFKK